VYRCRFGTIDRVETVRVYQQVRHPLRVDSLAHRDRAGKMSAQSRAAPYSTAASSQVRIVAEVIRHIRDLGGDDARVVLCGARRVIAPLKQQLDTVTPTRVLALDWLNRRATDAEVVEAARAGAAVLWTAAQGQPIDTTGELVEVGGYLTS
jgi:hypothetical protein